MTIADTSVLIDVLDRDENWMPWSRTQLEQAVTAGPLLTNHVVIAELSVYFGPEDSATRRLEDLGIGIVDLDVAAALRAGQAFREYRRRGGTREAILADFPMAGHAAALGALLLTRDKRRVGTYFPDFKLITPENDNG